MRYCAISGKPAIAKRSRGREPEAKVQSFVVDTGEDLARFLQVSQGSLVVVEARMQPMSQRASSAAGRRPPGIGHGPPRSQHRPGSRIGLL
jgi:hypothetical protein